MPPPQPLITDWVLAWSTVALTIATFALALVAAFQDWLRDRLFPPVLSLSLDVKPPHCQVIPIWSERVKGWRPSYYFRIRIHNNGRSTAKNVEVFVAGLTAVAPDRTETPINSFLPMNLKWSHVGKPWLDSLLRGLPKYCDLGHVVHPKYQHEFFAEAGDGRTTETKPEIPQTQFTFDLEFTTARDTHVIQAGHYRITLRLGASNCKATDHVIDLRFTGRWSDCEDEMFANEIQVSLV